MKEMIPPCVFDEKGVCQRHGRPHRGNRAQRWSQEMSEAGDRYRRLQDRLNDPGEMRAAQMTATYQHRSRVLVSPVGPKGPGDCLEEILKQRGITPRPGCSCKAIMREMNSLGVEGCRRDVDRLAERMRRNKSFMSWSDQIKAAYAVAVLPMLKNWAGKLLGWEQREEVYLSFREMIVDACRVAEANAPKRQEVIVSAELRERRRASARHLVAAATSVSAAPPPRPWGAPIKWAAGITTVPERRELIKRTVASLRAAGFEGLRVFADGDGGEDGELGLLGLDVTYRGRPALGAWSNWWLSLWELFLRSPDAERFAIFQDDLACVRNLRAYLDAVPWVPRTYLNLFTFSNNELLVGRHHPRGFREAALLPPKKTSDSEAQAAWNALRLQCGRGALALVFDREALMALLQAKSTVERPLGHPAGIGRTRIDGGVVDALNKAGFREMVHNPSLVQHTGILSTIGNGMHGPAKPDEHGRVRGVWKEDLARTFPGEEFDAMSLAQTKG